MKAKLIKLALGLIAVSLVSCGTGTTIRFGESGIEVVPPATPFVIPTK
jgi:hypothetical protein